jgi:predicted metal-dependent enzyme (double-stranded beta helix superfamily)
MPSPSDISFNLDSLVKEISTASRGNDPKSAVKTIMERVFEDTHAIQEGIPVFDEDEVNLFEDDAISIWVCRFMPGAPIPPHDHQMDAIIGLYAGVERNRFFKRDTSDTITESGHVDIKPGEILNISPTAVHAVECISEEPSCGIHVYFGPLQSIDRSLFDQRAGTRLKFTEKTFNRLCADLR